MVKQKILNPLLSCSCFFLKCLIFQEYLKNQYRTNISNIDYFIQNSYTYFIFPTNWIMTKEPPTTKVSNTHFTETK